MEEEKVPRVPKVLVLVLVLDGTGEALVAPRRPLHRRLPQRGLGFVAMLPKMLSCWDLKGRSQHASAHAVKAWQLAERAAKMPTPAAAVAVGVPPHAATAITKSLNLCRRRQ